MVKPELVDALVRAFPGVTKQDMSGVVDALFGSMAQALMGGEAVEVRGVGRFKIKERGAMAGRNPKTDAPVDVPARWVVHFRAADSLTRRINS
ncbi:MAG: HU family DNA-binding protein [Thermodesulfobacteriota bacterium]|nr:HU family DNA-binding protein [Thermodesulfobacteriota bacterium]